MCFARSPEVSFAFLILLTFFSIKCDLMASTSIKQGNWCTCLDSEEARNISSSGKPHVHCSCFLCKGKAVYPMTAWRHVQRANRARTETLNNQLPVPSNSSSKILDTCDVFQASNSFCEFPSDQLFSIGLSLYYFSFHIIICKHSVPGTPQWYSNYNMSVFVLNGISLCYLWKLIIHFPLISYIHTVLEYVNS